MSSGEGRPTQARHAPPPRPLVGTDQLQSRLVNLLSTDYALSTPTSFMVFLEGTTDVRYLERAAELAREDLGQDFLRIPSAVAPYDDAKITLCSPGRPGASHRGGIPQMVRLAKDIETYVFTLEAFGGVLFVFDGDEEGSKAIGELRAMRYREKEHMISLSAPEHPGACGDRGLVIEDLLSLRIQREFFDRGGASCDVTYREGALTRFKWGHDSKSALCEYVLSRSEIDDLGEVLTLLRRIRMAFGFGEPSPK